MAGVKLVGLMQDTVPVLKKLNDAVLSMRYAEAFYKELMVNEDCVRLVYVDGRVVGGITCRVDASRAYVLTIGVLPRYRRRGIGNCSVNCEV